LDCRQRRAGEIWLRTPRRAFVQRTLPHSTINRSGAASDFFNSSAPAASDRSSLAAQLTVAIPITSRIGYDSLWFGITVGWVFSPAPTR
jgi:hypothetical protein